MNEATRANADAWWRTVMERRRSHPKLIVVPSRVHDIDLVDMSHVDVSRLLDSLTQLEDISQ